MSIGTGMLCVFVIMLLHDAYTMYAGNPTIMEKRYVQSKSKTKRTPCGTA